MKGKMGAHFLLLLRLLWNRRSRTKMNPPSISPEKVLSHGYNTSHGFRRALLMTMKNGFDCQIDESVLVCYWNKHLTWCFFCKFLWGVLDMVYYSNHSKYKLFSFLDPVMPCFSQTLCNTYLQAAPSPSVPQPNARPAMLHFVAYYMAW